mgnify:CR=1 FL=1
MQGQRWWEARQLDAAYRRNGVQAAAAERGGTCRAVLAYELGQSTCTRRDTVVQSGVMTYHARQFGELMLQARACYTGIRPLPYR